MKTRAPDTVKDSKHMADMKDPLGESKKGYRNPLVLCGAIATAGVLAAGLVSFTEADCRKSQRWMRTRVACQAATVALMVASVYLYQRQS